ncbi:MAG TPA: hypothetical protein GXX18_02565 [Bacillales bacterium]|nr:hypothetical protein [Bacillales bacterium]
MNKKIILSFSLIATLFIFIFSNVSWAASNTFDTLFNEENFTPFIKQSDSENSSKETETQNPEATIQASTAGGNVACMNYNGIAECNWYVTANELITYSNVKVILESYEGFLNGGWKEYDSKNFSYPVNIATKTIRNQANFFVGPGTYRAKFGGSFTTIEGVYYPFISNPSTFEVQ